MTNRSLYGTLLRRGKAIFRGPAQVGPLTVSGRPYLRPIATVAALTIAATLALAACGADPVTPTPTSDDGALLFPTDPTPTPRRGLTVPTTGVPAKTPTPTPTPRPDDPTPTPTATPTPAPPVEAINLTLITIDGSDLVGRYAALTIGGDGLPLIAYFDDTNDDLKLAHCADLGCTSATVSTVDSEGNVGRFASIATGRDGLPVIAYFERRSYLEGALKVAHCDTPSCDEATISVLDVEGNTGAYPSIAIGSDGFPIVAYFEDSARDLRTAHCLNVACTRSTVSIVDPRGEVGVWPSIAIGPDGFPRIAYEDFSHNTLNIVRCLDVACTNDIGRCETPECIEAILARSPNPLVPPVVRLSPSAGKPQHPSLAILPDGSPAIAFLDEREGSLGIVTCPDGTCETYNLSTLGPDTGRYASIDIGPAGIPWIAHHAGTAQDLLLTRCQDQACATSDTIVVAQDGNVGINPSLHVGSDGRVLLAYYDARQRTLAAATCRAAGCGF